jgi:Domain of unknown function (DUF4062)
MPLGDDAPPVDIPIHQRKFQIFVSSTFEDLKEERRAVTEVILSMGHIPVGMELFEAGNEDQWSYIVNRISEVDYYVVIVAERYGSVGPAGYSYTEMEYRYATESKVPVAAFLLDESRRKTWEQSKVDFAHKDNVEAFRKLCQTRMVNFWTDAGTLSAKCQLALNRLFRQSPRTGWVSASQAASPHLATELARLSEENAKLRDELASRAGQDRAALEVERAVALLREPLKTDFEKLRRKYGGPYDTLFANPKLRENLEKTSLFDLISDSLVYYFDGETQSTIEARMARKLGADVKDESQISYAGNTALLLMRTARVLEGYQIMRGTETVKMVKLSDIGRRAFDLAFTRFVDDT